MQEIKLIEFQRLFSKVIQQYKSLIVWNQEGVIGYWLDVTEYNDLTNRVRHAEESLKLALESQNNESVSDNIEQEANPISPDKCNVCKAKIYTVWHSGKYWSDGEELDLVICHNCYKKHKPKNFKQHGSLSQKPRR